MTSTPTTTPTTTTNPDAAAREVAERIRAGRNFLITSHRNPDGDALGSGLALQGLIRAMGKSARVQVRDGFGKALHNIPGASEVDVTDHLPADYPRGLDAVFTMECPEVERTGYGVLPGPVLNIDHHLGNTMYGEINYLDLVDRGQTEVDVLHVVAEDLHERLAQHLAHPRRTSRSSHERRIYES